MSDAPKHPADPANELASGHSAIDPRDFRKALGASRPALRSSPRLRRTSPPWAYLQLLRVGVAQSTTGALESGDFFPDITAFQNATHFAINVLGIYQQPLAAQFASPRADKFEGVDLDAGPRRRSAYGRKRCKFSMPHRRSLLWRRPCHLPRCRRGLCL